MRLHEVRLNLQRPPVAGHRLVELPLLFQSDAQVVVRIAVVRCFLLVIIISYFLSWAFFR